MTDSAVTLASIRDDSWCVVVQADALSPAAATAARMTSRRVFVGFALSIWTAGYWWLCCPTNSVFKVHWNRIKQNVIVQSPVSRRT
jgi:hypothetical protein